jgi:hypothetical protein
MSNNAENEGGSIHGDNNASNVGGSIHGDNNSSNEGGSIGGRHHGDIGDPGDPADPGRPAPVDPVVGYDGQIPTDGVTLAFPIVHNLGTRNTLEAAFNPITGTQYVQGIAAGNVSFLHTSDDVTTVLFVAPAPAPGTARITIVGVK